MDISVFSIISIFAVFLPLVYALYLFFARLSLTFVSKQILNYGCIVTNFISFLLLLVTNFFAPDKLQIAKLEFNFFFNV